jgi:hypothetical protein
MSNTSATSTTTPAKHAEHARAFEKNRAAKVLQKSKTNTTPTSESILDPTTTAPSEPNTTAPAAPNTTPTPKSDPTTNSDPKKRKIVEIPRAGNEFGSNLQYMGVDSGALHVWIVQRSNVLFSTNTEPFVVQYRDRNNTEILKRMSFFVSAEAYKLIPGDVGQGIVNGFFVVVDKYGVKSIWKVCNVIVNIISDANIDHLLLSRILQAIYNVHEAKEYTIGRLFSRELREASEAINGMTPIAAKDAAANLGLSIEDLSKILQSSLLEHTTEIKSAIVETGASTKQIIVETGETIVSTMSSGLIEQRTSHVIQTMFQAAADPIHMGYLLYLANDHTKDGFVRVDISKIRSAYAELGTRQIQALNENIASSVSAIENGSQPLMLMFSDA